MVVVPTVGVLALQGDFSEHIVALQRLSVSAREVRTTEQLEMADALIIPGGESTTMATLMDIYGLREPILAHARAGKPVWGTCAGMVLLASRLVETIPTPLNLMDILVQRNGFGRQIDSFETEFEVKGIGEAPIHGVFIRAPLVCEVGSTVEVLAQLSNGSIVAVRQGPILATSFHPELVGDDRLHRYFLNLIPDHIP